MLGRESVVGGYDKLLQAQPPKPKSFILNFVLDKTVLTDESTAMLPAVLEAVRQRKPTEITIFGHADASGPEKHNLKLSADRANVIADLLRKTDPSLDKIDVQYFGDKAPLYPSETGNPDPRNRRAEIMIL
jgi:outer membrane protein OmpA-like peptidoglycan-associated protein